MSRPAFKLENFFNKWEFKTPYLLCSSDNETLSLKELLSLADQECLALWENLNLGYTHSSGHPLLKREIRGLYNQVKEKGIGTFAGAGEALFAAMSAIVRPGDHVIAPYPCYQTLSDLPRQLGADVSLFPIREKEDGWHFDSEDLIRLSKPTTRLIVINFPHNPTSVHIDQFALEQIIACAKRSNAYLVSDEVYRFSEHDSKNALPPAADLYERAVSVGVMSKTMGLAGARVGWLASQDQELIVKALELKCYLSLCNSAPSEILSIIALRAKEEIIQRNLKIVRRNLDLLDSFFSARADLFRWKRPQAGSTAFIKLLTAMPVDFFVEDLISKEGVLLLPGSVYDYPGNYFRLGFGRKNLSDALDRLERYIKNRLK